MKVNFLIFVITAFLVANTYYDGKFTDYIIKGKKYYVFTNKNYRSGLKGYKKRV